MMRRLLLLLVLAPLAGCGARPGAQITPSTSAMPPSPNYEAQGAGRWYPADEGRLRAAVEAFLGQAGTPQVSGRLLAVIVPHAGYAYSGAVAGYAFRAMQQAGCGGKTVIVIGDTHSGQGSAPIAVWASGSFTTLLGSVAVDEPVAQSLIGADSRIQLDEAAFPGEHPVENQVPFIQVACPGARLVPIVIREPSLENAEVLGRALVAALQGRQGLIVASTDLSHYHPYDEARRIDEVALQAITSLDPTTVLNSPRRCTELGIGEDPLTMCSQGAVIATLIAATQMGADRATVLNYANSGDVAIGDRGQVVGYGAVAVWQATGEAGDIQATPGFMLAPTAAPTPELIPLSPEAKEELLRLARGTAAQYLASESFPSFRTDDPALLQPLAAFVTYRKDGELRGCVGRLESEQPLFLGVEYAAVAAALADSRFPPITVDELDGLSIEVTILHPMRSVSSPNDIQIGRDGVLLEVGEEGRAVFLPQVPPEEGWGLEQTLVNLCRKAGLADSCWTRADAHLSVFTAEWFEEGE